MTAWGTGRFTWGLSPCFNLDGAQLLINVYSVKLIWNYFKIIRIHNCLMASLGVAVGQYLVPGIDRLSVNPYAMLAAFFVCGYGNILNDIRDIESDRINHPNRPLPDGAISAAAAGYTMFLFFIISLVMLVFLNFGSRVIVLSAIALLTLYNYKLKHTVYWGNVIVAILSGLTFILGGQAGSSIDIFVLPGPLIAAVFAFLMHFGREIIKDIADRGGDAVTGSRTAPSQGRVLLSSGLALAAFALLIGLTIFVYQKSWFNELFSVITLVFVVIPIIYLSIRVVWSRNAKRWSTAAVLIKLLMIPGLVALVIGKNY